MAAKYFPFWVNWRVFCTTMADQQAMTFASPNALTASEQEVFNEVRWHWQWGFGETMKRATGRNRLGITSFDEADEMFRNWINETTWPYDALMFDPRIFTFIFEKTSRLIANKPEPRLTPREGGDVLMAKINNVLLDYQWDQANNGGSMLEKLAMMDMNCRKYGASFGLCKWRYEKDNKGKVVFDGPELSLINNRDFAHDLAGNSIENCNWVQVRQYVTFHELERVNDVNRSNPTYKNLDVLHQAISQENLAGGDVRGINWTSRNRAISKLEVDPIGKDPAYKTIEIISEYRRDRWITFSPRHGVILRDIPNPYNNYEIPVIMLRYYAIDDDLYGLSEIEPVKGLQKAANALLCQYIDEINQHLYTPIAIGPGVRQHTLEWGKGARWIMNNPMTDYRLVESKSNATQYFNTTYSVIVSAMMNALGESSLGVSNTQPYSRDKTATEVQSVNQQRNARDNFQQLMLQSTLSRLLKLWHSMNQNLLFTDPAQPYYVIRVVGRELIQDFQDLGLGDDILPDEAMTTMYEQAITDPEIMNTPQGEQQNAAIAKWIQNNKVKYLQPKHAVNRGSESTPDVVNKFIADEKQQAGTIYVTREDLEGTYDYKVDVEPMSVNSDDSRRQARQTTVSLLITNPNVAAMLQQDGTKPKFKELLISWLEELGWPDADRYFEPIPQQGAQQGQPGQPGQPPPGPDPAQQVMQQLQQNSPQGMGGPTAPAKPGDPMGAAAQQAGLSKIPGYFSFAPPNSLMGVPAYVQQRYAAQFGTRGAFGGPNPVPGMALQMPGGGGF